MEEGRSVGVLYRGGVGEVGLRKEWVDREMEEIWEEEKVKEGEKEVLEKWW